MGDLVQYEAINDVEEAVRQLARTRKGPVAVVFDGKAGWCVTDEVERGKSQHGRCAPVYQVRVYEDWYRVTLGEAIQAVYAVRFLPGSLLGKLFRRPPMFAGRLKR